MTAHYPECEQVFAAQDTLPEDECLICAALRACEQRVYDERNEAWVKKCRASERHALDAAREAVAALPISGGFTTPEGRFEEVLKADALAAIDALRGER